MLNKSKIGTFVGAFSVIVKYSNFAKIRVQLSLPIVGGYKAIESQQTVLNYDTVRTTTINIQSPERWG